MLTCSAGDDVSCKDEEVAAAAGNAAFYSSDIQYRDICIHADSHDYPTSPLNISLIAIKCLSYLQIIYLITSSRLE